MNKHISLFSLLLCFLLMSSNSINSATESFYFSSKLGIGDNFTWKIEIFRVAGMNGIDIFEENDTVSLELISDVSNYDVYTNFLDFISNATHYFDYKVNGEIFTQGTGLGLWIMWFFIVPAEFRSVSETNFDVQRYWDYVVAGLMEQSYSYSTSNGKITILSENEDEKYICNAETGIMDKVEIDDGYTELVIDLKKANYKNRLGNNSGIITIFTIVGIVILLRKTSFKKIKK